jgi:hypothetical protein
LRLLLALLSLALVAFPLATPAQSPAPAADATSASTNERLQRLEQQQQELERQLKQKDAEIQDLQKQVNPAQGNPQTPAAPAQAAGAAATGAATAAPSTADTSAQNAPAAAETSAPQKWGTYTPFLGFKVANTDYGDMNIAIYTYVRYLNQLGLDSSYTDAFGNTKSVQRRQEVQILKVQIKFLGWIMSPQFRYFLYAWSSNATQGQGAQVVLAGNLGYTFNEHFTFAGGITSLPGTRSVEGNFPFWLNVDNRMMADEFFRPSYTSGFWAKGDITTGLRYQIMIGNNLSTLGVSSAQLNNKFNTLASALVWMPTTGEFGPGFGDFENHQAVATRFAVHYTRSTEDKQSQPGTDSIENTQIRLSDGSVIFTPNLFGPGITVNQVRYQMSCLDAGVKYHGIALEGEYYWRKLDQLEGTNLAGLRGSFFDRGFQLQSSVMIIPRTLQVYLAGSTIHGEYGDPYDVRLGVNWHPWKNRVFRWNTQVMYLDKSPVGYTSLTYNVGSRGVIFNTDFELAL